MHQKFYNSFLFILITILLSGCQEEKVSPREYPRLTTLEVTNITRSGAVFQAEVIYPGDGPITNHGFVWSDLSSPRLEFADRKSLGAKSGKGAFSVRVTSTLQKGKKYYVRSYATNSEYLVYGKEITFESQGSEPPVITEFSPQSGTIGDTVVIKGLGFSYLKTVNEVKFDTIKANIIALSDELLTIQIPHGLISKSPKAYVSVAGNMSSEDGFEITTPEIKDLKYSKISGSMIPRLINGLN